MLQSGARAPPLESRNTALKPKCLKACEKHQRSKTLLPDYRQWGRLSMQADLSKNWVRARYTYTHIELKVATQKRTARIVAVRKRLRRLKRLTVFCRPFCCCWRLWLRERERLREAARLLLSWAARCCEGCPSLVPPCNFHATSQSN